MIHALQGVAQVRHDDLLPHVDVLAEIADEIGRGSSDGLAERLAVEYQFMTETLVPHLKRSEQTLHPVLERLMQNRHSMAPMRREHAHLEALIAELGELRLRPMGFGVELRLRRVLYQLYAALKIHLAEEDAFLTVLERNLSNEEEEELAGAMAESMAGPLR